MAKDELISKPNKRIYKKDFPDHRPKKTKTTGRLNQKQLVHFDAMKHAYNDLLLGYTESMVKNKLVDDVYEVGKKYSDHSARGIVCEAKQLIIADMEDELRDLRITLMAKAFDVYTEAREAHDRRAALDSLNFISKISGALDPRYGQTNVQNIVIDFKFDEDNDEEFEEVDEG